MKWIKEPGFSGWTGYCTRPPITRQIMVYPRTYADDQDPMDVLVLSTESLDPMIMVKCYPIGVVRMVDCDEVDDKIIAIPLKDPTWNFYRDIYSLPPHISSEITHFFEVYKGLEHKTTAATEVLGPDSAKRIIAEAMVMY